MAFTWTYVNNVRLITTNNNGVIMGAGAGTQASGVTRFSPVGLALNNNTGEPNNQLPILVAKTFSGLWLNVTTNSIAATSTVNFRKNANNGNQTVSITASTTGTFEDTVNSDSVVANDLINYQVITGGASGSLGIGPLSILWNIPGPPPSTAASIQELMLMGIGT